MKLVSGRQPVNPVIITKLDRRGCLHNVMRCIVCNHLKYMVIDDLKVKKYKIFTKCEVCYI